MDDGTPRIWSSNLARRASFGGAGAILALVFVLDLNTPLGFAVCFGYAPAALVAMLTGNRAFVAAIAALGTALTLAGIALSPPALPGTPFIYIAAHRAMALAAIATCAGLSVFLIGMITRASAARRMLDMAGSLGKLGGWRVDLPEGRVHWSGEVARIHGRAEGFSPTLDEGLSYYAPEHQAAIRRRAEACVRDGIPFAEELQIVTQEGKRRWVRCVGRAVRNTHGAVTAIEGAFQDIDERKASENRVRQSLAAWHNLAEAMPMTVWTATADGVVDYVNQLLIGYAGIAPQELVAAGWTAIVHPDDRPRAGAAWASALAGLTPYETQFRLRRHDGAYRWHLTRAVFVPAHANVPAKWYGTIVDIDDQMQLQHQASSLAERLAATMESVGDAILTLDRAWRVVFINRHGEILLNRQRASLLGKYLWDEFPEAAGSTFQEQYERAVEQDVAVRFEEYFEPLKKYFEINAYPSGEGLTIYFRDITGQRLLAEQMLQAQKLESLGRLTGGVAHDFNNLLTVILGNAELLVEQSAPASTQHMLAGMIFGAAQRGADMTQRLLAFSRKQALEPLPSDLNALVSNMDQLLRHTLGAQVDIRMVRAAGLWTTLVDPGQLESALLNLAINARDAMPGGGALTIETANAQLDEAYAGRHNDVGPGQYVMLAVSDSGSGIAQEVLAQVFEPFFTTKQMGKGTGLGLAMVYGFVKQSKGHVEIYSEIGHGTTVKVYLPRLPGAEAVSAPPAVHGPVHAGGGQLILLAEDDAMVRAFARRQLEELGYRVIEARSGAEALALLDGHAGVDLLLTDVVMPGGMSGRQLADAAQALRPALPVLYTSGYTEDAIVHHGRLDPGVILLSKPYRRADLAQKVASALGTLTDPMDTQ